MSHHHSPGLKLGNAHIDVSTLVSNQYTSFGGNAKPNAAQITPDNYTAQF